MSVIPALARNRRSPSGRVSLLAGGEAGIQRWFCTVVPRLRGDDNLGIMAIISITRTYETSSGHRGNT